MGKKILWVIIPLIMIIGLGLVLAFTPILDMLAIGEAGTCENTPYHPDCSCGDNQRKIDVKWNGIPKWNCENIDQLLIDPESPTFEDDAIDFVQEYLALHCGDICTDLSCGDLCDGQQQIPVIGDKCISAVYGYGSAGERLVNIECKEILSYDSQGRPSSGRINWRMQFFVESETAEPYTSEVFENYCVDPDNTDRCEPPMEIIPLNGGSQSVVFN